jgi:hypothetical protein
LTVITRAEADARAEVLEIQAELDFRVLVVLAVAVLVLMVDLRAVTAQEILAVEQVVLGAAVLAQLVVQA